MPFPHDFEPFVRPLREGDCYRCFGHGDVPADTRSMKTTCPVCGGSGKSKPKEFDLDQKDRRFCEQILKDYADLESRGFNGVSSENMQAVRDVVRPARIKLSGSDSMQERRFINCRDCEAWRGGFCRISPPRGSFVQTKTVGSDGCCEGFPKVGEQ